MNHMISITIEEIQTLSGLLDGAVKHLGLRAAKDAHYWVQKLEAAGNEIMHKQNKSTASVNVPMVSADGPITPVTGVSS